jgi:hypothetical protein
LETRRADAEAGKEGALTANATLLAALARQERLDAISEEH